MGSEYLQTTGSSYIYCRTQYCTRNTIDQRVLGVYGSSLRNISVAGEIKNMRTAGMCWAVECLQRLPSHQPPPQTNTTARPLI